jgi:enamine deaminase RidA (YjgF/YER057c/UK114 family)
MDTKKIERVRGSYNGRNRSSAYQDLVFTVATAESTDACIETQTNATLEKIECNLIELGSNKHKILSAQVYLANISDKAVMDKLWCEWLGSNPEHWPQRTCLGVNLEGRILIEVSVTAVR